MFWYNGQLFHSETITLQVNDPALLYGATIFTTLRVYNHSLDNSLTHWQAHCSRLYNSLQSLGWSFPDWNLLREGAENLLAVYPVLRITIFPDGREWIIGRSLPLNLTQLQQEGVTGWVADSVYQRSFAIHKTGNYLGAWLAMKQAEKLGAKEAILIDSQGNWLETSTGNLWGYKDGCWYTPPGEAGILPGIMRQKLLHWLKEREIPVFELAWSKELVKTLQAIAYTNSVVEIIPFTQINREDEVLQLPPNHPALEQLKTYFYLDK